MPEKPKLQREILDQLWYAMYGVNGSDGIVKRVERIETEMRSVEDEVHGCVEPAKPNGKKPRRLELLVLIVGLAVSFQALGLLDAIRGFVWQALTGRPTEPPPAIEENINARSE